MKLRWKTFLIIKNIIYKISELVSGGKHLNNVTYLSTIIRLDIVQNINIWN